MKTVKRFIVFMRDDRYDKNKFGLHGWHEVLRDKNGDTMSFDTFDQARTVALRDNPNYKFLQIVDIWNDKIVFESAYC